MDDISRYVAQPHSLPPRISDHPVLLLVYFHKALRWEFLELHRLALTAFETRDFSRELVIELQRRFEFLKLFFKYHCVAAEDEVIFLALDNHVKNVALTYTLEHMGIEGLFDSIFQCLNALMEEKEDMSKLFQDLVVCIGTVQTSICQHMMKEEQQVFPLLMQHIPSKEQGVLLWQFLCSVPVMLLEDFLPWTISRLSPNEQAEFVECVKRIVPKERLLQEVVKSWLQGNRICSTESCSSSDKEAEYTKRCWSTKSRYKLDISKSSYQEIWKMKKPRHVEPNTENPVDALCLCHVAISDELKELLQELYQMKTSKDFTSLSLLVVMLRFLVEVLVFYSNALEKFFFPVLNGHRPCCTHPSSKQLPSKINYEVLQQLLNYNTRDSTSLCKFVGRLCGELESFLVEVGSQFTYQEKEVFPVISMTCSHEMQQCLLYRSLHMMPLGLLKCVVSWFSARLSEQESKMLLNSIKREESFFNRSFASLLHEWIRIGCSGKTSVGKFRRDLQGMFKTTCSLLGDKIKQDARSPLLLSDVKLHTGSNPAAVRRISAKKGENATLYSSSINQHIFFPGTIKKMNPFSKFGANSICGSSTCNEPRPMDLLCFFHKALKRDLERLVFNSAKLDENFGFLNDFYRQFCLVRLLYQIHRNAEDEIVFPAQEGKGQLQNISHSYTIDHSLEVQHFDTISVVLDEVMQLHISLSSTDSDKMNQMILKRQQLCRKLHNMCESLQRLLLSHISREESLLWPLCRECFTDQEQERIIGCILGRTQSEVLQDMIPSLMASLTREEYDIMMSLWRKIARNTMFSEWLEECWDASEIAKVTEGKSPTTPKDPLDIVTEYLAKVLNEQKEATISRKTNELPPKESVGTDAELSVKCSADDKCKEISGDQPDSECSECTKLFKQAVKKNSDVAVTPDITHKPGELAQMQNSRRCGRLLPMSQKDLEAAIRRVYHDSSLDPQQKSYIAQNLLMSRWIVRQQISNAEETISSNGDQLPGQSPSYQDPYNTIFGCEHYKRNCKLVAPCCNKLYTCRRCHDETADHILDRKSINKMMCMKCLVIQPIGPTCSTPSCNNFSMARYYCKICRLFDDERDIYHCPYCNLCRVGKGLGISYFHCMNCNACMSMSLIDHECREKSLQDNCPICHEDMFTSCEPVKSLSCGHLMHSKCFQEYTITHYTCPICSKTLGDMKVYFEMLDALLAEEKMPDEYSGKTQVILCNDCEKKGTAPYHWLYHKCPHCGSYSTRVL